jgi:hypothetical protein
VPSDASELAHWNGDGPKPPDGIVPIEAGDWPRPPPPAPDMPPGIMLPIDDIPPIEPIIFDIFDIMDIIEPPLRWVRCVDAAFAAGAKLVPASRQIVAAIKSFFILISSQSGGTAVVPIDDPTIAESGGE